MLVHSARYKILERSVRLALVKRRVMPRGVLHYPYSTVLSLKSLRLALLHVLLPSYGHIDV